MLRAAVEPARGPRAVVYLTGGLAVCAAALAGVLPLDRVPWAVAACLLVCAAACGPGDGPWGAGIVLLLVGAGAWLAEPAWTPRGLTPTILAAVGGTLGLALVAELHARGRPVGLLGALTAAAGTAVTLVDQPGLSAFQRPLTWGVLLVLVGSVNLLLWARDREVGLTGPRG